MLLSIEDYRRLAGEQRTIAELLAMPGIEDIESSCRGRANRRGPPISIDVHPRHQRRLGVAEGAGGEGRSHLASWSGTVAATDLYLSVITIEELEIGVLLAERRDAAKGALLRAWMAGHVLPAFRERILPIDLAVALRSARAQRARPAPGARRPHCRDGARARHDGRDPQRDDFAATGAPTLNPWDYRPNG